jgi:hypothetical protein
VRKLTGNQSPHPKDLLLFPKRSSSNILTVTVNMLPFAGTVLSTYIYLLTVLV